MILLKLIREFNFQLIGISFTNNIYIYIYIYHIEVNSQLIKILYQNLGKLYFF